MTQTDFELSPLEEDIRWGILERSSQAMLLISKACLFIAGVAFVWLLIFPPDSSIQNTPLVYPAQAQVKQPIQEAITPVETIPLAQVLPTAVPTPPAALIIGPQTDNRPLVGLISGHAGYDSGAVCDDGLTEAEVNQAVTLTVANLLEGEGVRVDLLEEFDPRLDNYQADALLSIHADSCTIAGATGFKAAHSAVSGIPEIETRFVSCLIDEYGAETKLPEHPNSITHDMLHYHAFRAVDINTPAAIIELGFLLDDRYLLQHRPDLLAQGVAKGILCFLEMD